MKNFKKSLSYYFKNSAIQQKREMSYAENPVIKKYGKSFPFPMSCCFIPSEHIPWHKRIVTKILNKGIDLIYDIAAFFDVEIEGY